MRTLALVIALGLIPLACGESAAPADPNSASGTPEVKTGTPEVKTVMLEVTGMT